jgi:hypothetical protein
MHLSVPSVTVLFLLPKAAVQKAVRLSIAHIICCCGIISIYLLLQHNIYLSAVAA